MNIFKNTACLMALTALIAGCTSAVRLTGVERTRILVDARYDAAPDKETAAFIAPFKHKVDSIMSPVVGRAACYMSTERPESKLSNLLADILLDAGKDYGEQPVFAVYNMGGIRAALAKGDITYGDVVDVAPFENKICFVTLTGDAVLELFRQIASTGGEGVSRGVALEITADGRLVSARLDGNEIRHDAEYCVATLDYLAQGNDKMTAFKKAKALHQPEGDTNNVRFIIIKDLKEKMNRGIEVCPQTEGRIKIVKQ